MQTDTASAAALCSPPRRRRRVRRPFAPVLAPSPYRLPPSIFDRLTASLAPFRNRDAALALAVFLGRYWTAPGRLDRPFQVDRRALAGHRHLDLTEARVRGALDALERIQFIVREAPPRGSRYKATEDGLRCKPIQFRFGAEFAPAFKTANARVAAARGGNSIARKPLAPPPFVRPSQSLPAPFLRSPEHKLSEGRNSIMGELARRPAPRRFTAPTWAPPASPIPPDTGLAAALSRLAAARARSGAPRVKMEAM